MSSNWVTLTPNLELRFVKGIKGEVAAYLVIENISKTNTISKVAPNSFLYQIKVKDAKLIRIKTPFVFLKSGDNAVIKLRVSSRAEFSKETSKLQIISNSTLNTYIKDDTKVAKNNLKISKMI